MFFQMLRSLVLVSAIVVVALGLAETEEAKSQLLYTFRSLSRSILCGIISVVSEIKVDLDKQQDAFDAVSTIR